VFLSNEVEQQRQWAVQRFLAGEKPESIYVSLGRTKAWLYKWVDRYEEGESWYETHTRRPLTNPKKTASEVEEIVKIVRLKLYNNELFCGAQAILWELEDRGIKPLPSMRTINRILSRNELTHRRTGRYVPKGKQYPKLPSLLPNQSHQADHVGPCYLKGPVRFYSLNVIDLATGRCGLDPASSKSGQCVTDGIWAIWKRLGMPDNLQIDNASSFYGSPRHPRGMGPLIRLCLFNKVEPWFIPVAEPWRNGVVEKFNELYEQKFLNKIAMATKADLEAGSLAFEQRHNCSFKYSKLGGKTPLKALATSERKLRFPERNEAPSYSHKKPEAGRYHVVRFIRSDQRLNVFGELFRVPPELEHEYVVATIDAKEQKLKLYLDKTQVEEFDYQLR
jgi:putative transposase